MKEVQTYKYLGILFSSSGIFYTVKMFYIKPDERQILNKCFGELHQIVGTMLHLFGHIVKPGLLYDSEL